MIEEPRWIVDPFDTPRETTVWMGLLRRLPQPLHLLEFVSSTQHYHFGCFERPGEPLELAQDRMSLLGSRHFARGASVLDIGCGMGGTSRLLTDLGLRVTALDPCHEALVYARKRARSFPQDERPRYLAQSLQDYAGLAEAGSDGALAIEVLQHFPDLGLFFDCCRRLLRPGATLVLHDLSTSTCLEGSQAAYHGRGRIRTAAEAAGFRLIELRDLSQAIQPTLPSWSDALRARRAALVDAFDGTRQQSRPVESELEQLLAHMGALHRALEQGDLVYETMAFRAESPARSFPCG